MPAIYSGASMKPYRDYLSAASWEASASLAGSFVADSIDDYYLTPWDLGYGHLVKFDHDFIGARRWKGWPRARTGGRPGCAGTTRTPSG